MIKDNTFAQKRIGILGGSFNPAHRGHLHVSKQALDLMYLDEVWWMVSPQNPLKSSNGMADFGVRIESAHIMARDSRIRVTDIEADLGTTYTAETLKKLKEIYSLTNINNNKVVNFHKNTNSIYKGIKKSLFEINNKKIDAVKYSFTKRKFKEFQKKFSLISQSIL